MNVVVVVVVVVIARSGSSGIANKCISK